MSASAPATLRPVSQRAVYVAGLLAFLLAAAATLYFLQSMRGGMLMPGGWVMSMMWMVMPGQTLLTTAALFALMWLAMMVAMMLPSSLPMLLLYRRAAWFSGETRVGRATWMVAIGYFFVWLMFGILAYAMGMALARSAMASEVISRALPLGSGLALVIAGAYQLTPWKAACLRHCRDPLEIVAGHLHGGPSRALRLGIQHGVFCAACCWALMLIQLVLGVMNLAVMVAVAVVIALEKLLPRGQLVARMVGAAAIAGGVLVALRPALF